ncbi:MATE family efflux transporter [Peredibacter starrii]|uniref:Multidrug-efflux transporter n=1 Tax=Peredibacter starrii TaxID=28202 RepID=A0AAX4HP36_9BACT|nr:MATE family efflux transporter [Peredibacter starrii]WPU64857.1 MATE family efflux transporter [Peredibacter starrii]
MTTNVLPRKEALKQLLIFALPIIFGQLGLMLVGTGDMIIAGRYSRECLAAIGLAISIANPIQISLLGMQFAISPLLAQKRGNGESIDDYFWTVTLYSFFVGLVSFVLTYLSIQIVPWLNYGPTLQPIILDYILITSFSSFGLCFYQSSKEFFQSQEKTLAANILAMLAVFVNLYFNYSFVYGVYGMPELKEQGLAWASLIVRMLMATGLFAMTYKYWKSSKKVNWNFMKELLRLGTPITASLFFEIMAFCAVTLFVGKFDAIQTAANNLALNIGSLSFMIPMSISAAVGVKVGHAYGEKNYENVRIFSQVSLFASFCFTLMTGLFFYLFPEVVMGLYTDDNLVVDFGKKLLFWVACFQLFDGAQVTIAGILRGLSITKASSLAIFTGYWLIGIPLGYYLGFFSGLEAQGFWVGLATSLAVVAVMLGMILRKKLNQL